MYFYANGGSVNTSGFEVNDEYSFITLDDTYYHAKYTSDGTIKNINSINGKKFVLSKKGTSLVKGREWYTRNNYDNKIYYFNESIKYKVSDVLKAMGI